MSAIAKPCIFFSTATVVAGQSDVCINVDQIAFMEKQNVPAKGVGNPAQSNIMVRQIGETNVRVFRFASSGARDTAFAAAKALIAASV